MLKKLLLTGLCMAFLSVSSMAYAEKVYVTANGKKYHKADCRSIKNRDTMALEEKEAIAQGYEPCGRCMKDRLSKDEKGKKTTKVAKKNSTKKTSK